VSWLLGVGQTRFGKLEGQETLDLMSSAAEQALQDAHLERSDIDGLICGYSTVLPHLMLSTLFAEHFGLSPQYAHSVQLGGATGFAMLMLAHALVEAGVAKRILVVAGETRATGQSSDSAIQTLAQVGHKDYEVPLGATVPAYYALAASRYMHDFGIPEAELAEIAVLMRRNAVLHPDAHFRDPISIDHVMASLPIATPLKLLDCCPISDGGVAFVVGWEKPADVALRIRSAAQAHTHQHISAAPDLIASGAGISSATALRDAGIDLGDVEYAAIYDSFTITLAMLLEEIGFCERGMAGRYVRDGYFDPNGSIPLNTHGGLLSFGHCGVAGALAHLVETARQMGGRAGTRQIAKLPKLALLHGDGGILSSHVSLVLERTS